MAKVKLTAGRIEAFTCPTDKPQAFLWDADVNGLAVRVTTGAKAYIYQGRLNGKSLRMTIGDVRIWSLEEYRHPKTGEVVTPGARQEARRLQAIIDQGRDPRLIKQEIIAADVAKRESKKREQEAKFEAKEQTLEKLLFAYCDHLKTLKRNSHRDARSIFNLHVVAAFPSVADKPAANVTPEEIADMMRRLMEEGKGRTANKLRSYVRAAYQTAKSARLSASVPVKFKAFKITFNPASETVPDAKQNRADKNPLLQEDLITYWQTIKVLPGLRGAALRLHLLTGGQRIAQLVTLLSANITTDAITIYDGKGRPGTEPRPHIVPLIPAAKKALDEITSGGHYALSTDKGETHIHATTLLKWAQDATKNVLPGFTSKRIRSGVETLLSQRGFSREIRGRLQSHGITGVQDRHYDGYDYLPEKRKALMALYHALEQKKAKVTPIHSNVA